jgi:hypothetical protein
MMRTKGSHNTAPNEPKAPRVTAMPSNPLPARKDAIKNSAMATSLLAAALERHMTTPQVPGAKRES